MGPALYAYLREAGTGDGPSIDWGGGPSTAEWALLYGAALLVGILLAVALSVRQ